MTASQPTTQRLQTGDKASQPGGTIMACPETVSGPCYIHDGIHTCRGSEGGSISFLRQKARAQKARKLGLSGLLASFPYINFALLIGQIYVFFRVLNDGFHRGKNQGLCMLWHKGVGENGLRFAEEWQSKPFMHTETICRNPKIIRQTRLV